MHYHAEHSNEEKASFLLKLTPVAVRTTPQDVIIPLFLTPNLLQTPLEQRHNS
jgi:hypothetical protein